MIKLVTKTGLFIGLLAQNSDNSKLRNHQNSAKFRQNSAKFSPKLRFSEFHEKFIIHYLNISLVKLIKLLSNHTLLSQLTILPKKNPIPDCFSTKIRIVIQKLNNFEQTQKKILQNWANFARNSGFRNIKKAKVPEKGRKIKPVLRPQSRPSLISKIT